VYYRNFNEAESCGQAAGVGDWIHEVKVDGYRTQLYIEPEGRRMFPAVRRLDHKGNRD